MTRIIAGSARGRRLKAPRGTDIRPTPARVREAAFGILAERIVGATVLDLYCGIGALGIEALSRGAGTCTFVDRSRRALAFVRSNLELCGLADRARCLRRQLPEQLDASLGGPFSVVFSDPPYAEDPVPLLAHRLSRSGLLTDDALWVHEGPTRRASADEARDIQGWSQIGLRRYGDTALWLFRATPVGAHGA